MASYPPLFSDQGVIDLCTNAGYPVSVDGFYSAINDATGNTNGSIDDVWKLYITDVLGYEYVGQHPAHYGLTFGDALSVWELDATLSAPEDFPISSAGALDAGFPWSRSSVASNADPELEGDFPTDSAVFGPAALIKTSVGWGHLGGTSDNIGGLWIEITTPITQLVASAILYVRPAAGGLVGSPVCRVRAVNESSPILPSAGANSALGKYTTVGWTDFYTDFTPVAATVAPVDVTDIINEIVLAHGTTGTSILFTFNQQGGSVGTAASWNMTAYASYVSKLTIVRSLNHRDYQTKLLNGSVMWYWPFDADDSGTTGLQAQHRVVYAPDIPPNAASAPISYSAATGPSEIEFYARPAFFGQVPREFPSELENNRVRQFFGPSPDAIPDPEFSSYGNTYRASGTSRDYVMFAQNYILTSAATCSLLLDVIGNLSLVMNISHGPTAINFSTTWTGDQVGMEQSFPISIAPGVVLSIGLYYSSVDDMFYLGYSVGSGWVWLGTFADVGGTAATVSGVQYGQPPGEDTLVQQGWICLECTPVITQAIAERAMLEMRTLWKAGIKSLPPVLYA